MKRCKHCYTSDFKERTKCVICGSTSFFDDVFEGFEIIPTRQHFGQHAELVKPQIDEKKYNRI